MATNADWWQEKLASPEILTLALEPALYWIPLAGVLVLLWATVSKEPKSRILGLLLIIIGCGTIVVVAHVYGLSAPRRIAVADTAGADAIRSHLERLDRWQFGYLIAAATAFLTLFFGREGGLGKLLTLATIAMALAAAATGFWLHVTSAAITQPML